ncbi:hypothetical protein [Geminisphaera colitermitum]|uniref:hypothetical protein n=1 Tax=Geminisphaera colitermitum TaxID=1148786 RepID=UPI0012FEADEC|nr:hypothetical protein [Geminisphaera colitermitum]
MAFTINGDSGLPYFFIGNKITLSKGTAGAKVAILDGRGNTVADGTFEADGAASFSLPNAGYYEAASGDAKRSFLVSYPRKPIPSVVGIDAHLSDDSMYKPASREQRLEMFQKHLILARHSGAWYLRDRFRWGQFQPKEGTWNDTVFSTFYLPQIEAGFTFLPAIEGLPSWAAAIPGKTLGPPKQEAWIELFRTLAARYGKRMPLLQVWNEPNPIGIAGSQFPGGITPDKFEEHFLRGARAGVDAANVEGVKLVLGGAAGMDLPWHEQLIRSGHLRHVDIFDVHPYATQPFTFEPAMRKILGWLDEAGFKGTVFGSEWSGTKAVRGPNSLAQMLVLWFSLDPRMREGALFQFDLRDWGAGVGTQSSYQMGIANSDFSPKPEFAAMNLAAHRLAGATHERTVTEEDKVSVQLIRDSDGQLFATAFADGERRSVYLQTKTAHVDITLAEGGPPLRRATLGGVLPLDVGDSKFIYLDGIEDLTLSPAIFAITEQPTPETSRQVSGTALPFVTYELWNPVDKAVTIRGTLKSGTGFQFVEPAFEVKLAPGERVARVSPIRYRGPMPEESHGFSVEIEVPEMDFKTTLPAVLNPAINNKAEISMLRDAQGNPCIRVSFEKQLASQITPSVRVGGIPAPLIMRRIDSKNFAFRSGSSSKPLPTTERARVTLVLRYPSGISYAIQTSLRFKDTLLPDAKQDIVEAGCDHPLNLYLAQPVILKGRSLSAVELIINNWRGAPLPVDMEIREESPTGKVLANATTSILTGSNWNMFVLDRVIETIEPGKTYWIVVLTSTTTDRVLWGYRKQTAVSESSAQFSHDRVGWSPLSHKGAPALQFSYRLYN